MKQIRFITYTLIAICLLLATSCKTTKKAAGSVNDTSKPETEFFQSLQESAFKFNTLTAKLNVTINIPGQHLSSRVDLKMVKDEAFQLSVQPFLGIEIFRAEISVDSIKVLDRMNKRYVAERISKLKGSMPVAFNFYNLQALFTNQVFLPGEQAITAKQYKRFTLNEEAGGTKLSAKDALDLLYIFSTDHERKLINTAVKLGTEAYALGWDYADFRLIGTQPFPMNMTVNFSGNGQVEGGMTLNFSKIEVDKPFTLDFPIPDKYKRVTMAEIIKMISNSKNSKK